MKPFELCALMIFYAHVLAAWKTSELLAVEAERHMMRRGGVALALFAFLLCLIMWPWIAITYLHPWLRRHAWKPWFWWAVLKHRDHWMPCEQCGFWNECFSYVELVEANYRALESHGHGPQPTVVNGPDKSVCQHCCDEMRVRWDDLPALADLEEWS